MSDYDFGHLRVFGFGIELKAHGLRKSKEICLLHPLYCGRSRKRCFGLFSRLFMCLIGFFRSLSGFLRLFGCLLFGFT